MELKPYRKTVALRLGAACVLAVFCLGLFSVTARAQSDATTKSSSAKKTTKTANSKTHAKAPASSSKASSTAKTRSASHPATGTHRKSTAAGMTRSSKYEHASSKRSSRKRTARGQQKIDSERAQAIQEALIREHYMTGEPTGTWNQASEDAMRRYQADHGWQSKTVPDSRALISLGLGPSHDHLLNPESAMTMEPEVSHAVSANSTPENSVSHSTEPTSKTPVPSADPPPAAASDHDTSGPQ
ncbi:MAG: peptidoglycan-binding domain-containing protein [Candidatus Sulfotelmatobacter sp.]